MPQVSIGLPVYNGERYLAQTLDSILTQTFTDFEVVICDNASTDRTADICRFYQARDDRVCYHRNEKNLGAARNFNRVFELSSAPLFHAGACDDLYDPAFVERCVDVLARHPEAVLSHTFAKMIGDDGEPLLHDPERNAFVDSRGDRVMGPEPHHIGAAARPEERFRQVLWLMNWCLPISGLIRRSAMLKTSLHGNYYGADKILLAELSLLGRFVQVEDALFIKRVHNNCSYYKSTLEKARHDCGGSTGIPQLNMLRDYARMILAADLAIGQRWHCMMSLAGMTRRQGLWRRLMVPGPTNYLAILFCRK